MAKKKNSKKIILTKNQYELKDDLINDLMDKHYLQKFEVKLNR